MQKEEKKRFEVNRGKKTDWEEANKIKPAFSPRFQTAAVTGLNSVYFVVWVMFRWPR